MERLILLRHGKAEAGSTSGEDIDRPLTERGRRESALIAAALAQANLAPDLALVSTAVRASQTWEAVAPMFPGARAIFLPALYSAAPEELWAQARGRGGATVMVVAHNPGLHQLALQMLAQVKYPPIERARLHAGFPTAAAAVFDLTQRTFRLLTPKALDADA
jgi:phosphohistidine phosphatase